MSVETVRHDDYTEWRIPVPAEQLDRPQAIGMDPAADLKATENYALLPFPLAITNWHELRQLIGDGDDWKDVTAFYSRRKTGLSKRQERKLDKINQKAFKAAQETKNLFVYYQGGILADNNTPFSEDLQRQSDDLQRQIGFEPNSLSGCIWTNRKDAQAGSSVRQHRRARKAVMKYYDEYGIAKYDVRVEGDNIIFRSKSFVPPEPPERKAPFLSRLRARMPVRRAA